MRSFWFIDKSIIKVSIDLDYLLYQHISNKIALKHSISNNAKFSTAKIYSENQKIGNVRYIFYEISCVWLPYYLVWRRTICNFFISAKNKNNSIGKQLKHIWAICEFSIETKLYPLSVAILRFICIAFIPFKSNSLINWNVLRIYFVKLPMKTIEKMCSIFPCILSFIHKWVCSNNVGWHVNYPVLFSILKYVMTYHSQYNK